MQDNNIIQEAIDSLKKLRKENTRLKSCLQEIKEIAENECKCCVDKRSDSCWICPYYPILDLIIKAESDIKNERKRT